MKYPITPGELFRLKESGVFHHATYRDLGKLHEGLYIYVKQNNGFNGFTLYGMVPKDDPMQDACYDAVASTGVSVGSYGNG